MVHEMESRETTLTLHCGCGHDLRLPAHDGQSTCPCGARYAMTVTTLRKGLHDDQKRHASDSCRV
jgi:hypothetical protein